MRKVNILELSPDELKGFITMLGEPAFRANQVSTWIWQQNIQTFEEMSNLPLALRQRLTETASIGSVAVADTQTATDGTTKLLFALHDGQTVETVLLPYDIGDSVCLSTQVGCKMGCLFCASGLSGFIRNLTPGEITAQLLTVRKIVQSQGRALKNIVLMGSGEPLDNWIATKLFLEAVRDPERLGMSLRHVTLSTSGLVPKIIELTQLGWPLNLAVSLHAADNKTRSRIMPINKKYPLEILIRACDHYAKSSGRRITYEYILLDGVNDDPHQAKELAKLLKGRLCHVNLISYNAVKELNLQPSSQEITRIFRDVLKNAGINVTVRRKMGSDIAAACGQLRNYYCREKNEG